MMRMLKAVMLREWRQILCGGAWKHLAGCACAVWFGSFLMTLDQTHAVAARGNGFGAQGRIFLWWIGIMLFSFLAGSRSRREYGDPALDPLLTAPLPPWTLVCGKFLAVFAVMLLYTAAVVPACFLPEMSSPVFTAETLAALLKCMLLLGGIGAALAPMAWGKSAGGVSALLLLGLFFLGNGLLLTSDFSQFQVQDELNYGALLLGFVLLLILCTATGFQTPVTRDRWGAMKLLLLLGGIFLPELAFAVEGKSPTLSSLFLSVPHCSIVLLLGMAALERLIPARRTRTAAAKHPLLFALYPLWGGSAMTFLLAAVVCGKWAAGEGMDGFCTHGNFALLFFYPMLTAFIRCFTREKAGSILLTVCGLAGMTGLLGLFGNWPLLLRFTDVFSCNMEQYGWFYGTVAALDVVLFCLLTVFPWQKARRNS